MVAEAHEPAVKVAIDVNGRNATETFSYAPVARGHHERVSRYQLDDGRVIDAIVFQFGHMDALVGISTRLLLRRGKESGYLDDILSNRKMTTVEVRKPLPAELEFLKRRYNGQLGLHPNFYSSGTA